MPPETSSHGILTGIRTSTALPAGFEPACFRLGGGRPVLWTTGTSWPQSAFQLEPRSSTRAGGRVSVISPGVLGGRKGQESRPARRPFQAPPSDLASVAGLEPATSTFGGWRSAPTELHREESMTAPTLLLRLPRGRRTVPWVEGRHSPTNGTPPPPHGRGAVMLLEPTPGVEPGTFALPTRRSAR